MKTQLLLLFSFINNTKISSKVNDHLSNKRIVLDLKPDRVDRPKFRFLSTEGSKAGKIIKSKETKIQNHKGDILTLTLNNFHYQGKPLKFEELNETNNKNTNFTVSYEDLKIDEYRFTVTNSDNYCLAYNFSSDIFIIKNCDKNDPQQLFKDLTKISDHKKDFYLPPTNYIVEMPASFVEPFIGVARN